MPRLLGAAAILIAGVVAVGRLDRAIIEGAERALEAGGEQYTPTPIVRETPPDTDPSRYPKGREAA